MATKKIAETEDLTISVGAGLMPRVIDALCHEYGWGAVALEAASPKERANFARENLALWLIGLVRENEQRLASEEAAAKVAAEVADLDIQVQ